MALIYRRLFPLQNTLMRSSTCKVRVDKSYTGKEFNFYIQSNNLLLIKFVSEYNKLDNGIYINKKGIYFNDNNNLPDDKIGKSYKLVKIPDDAIVNVLFKEYKTNKIILF